MAERRRDRQRDARLLAYEVDKRGAFESQHLAVRLRLDRRCARIVGEKCHLAKRLAPPQHPHLYLGAKDLVSGIDPDRSVRNQIEGVTRLVLPEDSGLCLEGQGLQIRSELGESDTIQPGEQIDLAKQPRIGKMIAGRVRCRLGRRRAAIRIILGAHCHRHDVPHIGPTDRRWRPVAARY
jgi:hypothetical protein